MVNFAILESVQEFRCHFALPTNQAQNSNFYSILLSCKGSYENSNCCR